MLSLRGESTAEHRQLRQSLHSCTVPLLGSSVTRSRASISTGSSLAVCFCVRFENSFFSLWVSACSLQHSVLLALGHFWDDSRVWGDLHLGRCERVLVCGHELSLVVGTELSIESCLPAVTNNDLGRVFVGHHHSRAWQSASVGQRVVRLKGLLGHAGVKAGSYLKHISTSVEV